MNRPPRPEGAKKRDYWWTVLSTDPVAIPLVRLLARKQVADARPGHVVSLDIGAVGGGRLRNRFSSRAGRRGRSLFYLAFVFDCIDGKLARALGVTSERGEASGSSSRRRSPCQRDLGLAVLLESTIPLLLVRRLYRAPAKRTVGGYLGVFLVIVYAVLAYYFLEISGAEKGEPGEGVGAAVVAALARAPPASNAGDAGRAGDRVHHRADHRPRRPRAWVGIAMVTAAILLTVFRRLNQMPKVLMLGLDGATYYVLDPAFEAGHMPRLQGVDGSERVRAC